MLPSLSATSPWGPELGVFSGYSLKVPVLGSSRPNLFAPCPVYQSAPSGASAGSCGRDFAVGTSYSLIDTFKVATAAFAAIAATSANHPTRIDIGNSLSENCSPEFPHCQSRHRFPGSNGLRVKNTA